MGSCGSCSPCYSSSWLGEQLRPRCGSERLRCRSQLAFAPVTGGSSPRAQTFLSSNVEADQPRTIRWCARPTSVASLPSVNYLSPAETAEIRQLAASGVSYRRIQRATGHSRTTIRKLLGPGDQRAGLRSHHAHRKAIGKPIVPPRFTGGSRAHRERKRSVACKLCCGLSHRRPVDGRCPKCRKPFAPERLEMPGDTVSNAGWISNPS